jgi:hypothetical protein
MNQAGRAPYATAVIVVGVTYALVGVTFAWPVNHGHAWRLAAWGVSAAAYAAHIWYECVGHRNAPRRAALHVALAAALGAFGLAVAATIHSLSVVSSNQQRRLLLIALVVWPIMTGLPAFLVGLVASKVLWHLRSHARTD